MVKAVWTLNLGIVKLELTQADIAALRMRSNRSPLYKGPCLILNRDTGLALDAGPTAKAGDHTCLWAAHAAPWQQWRLRGVGGGQVEIVSESCQRRLTTMSAGFEWGETWLDRKDRKDWSSRWRLSIPLT